MERERGQESHPLAPGTPEWDEKKEDREEFMIPSGTKFIVDGQPKQFDMSLRVVLDNAPRQEGEATDDVPVIFCEAGDGDIIPWETRGMIKHSDLGGASGDKESTEE